MFNILKKQISWQIVPEYKNTLSDTEFQSFDDAFNSQGEYVSGNVYKVSIKEKNYYLKKFGLRKRLIPRYLNPSKVKNEWQNMLWFRTLGIPAAKVVAYGQETRGWVVCRGIIITEELLDCRDLSEVADNHRELLQQPEWVAQVSHQLAEVTRTMHQHSFAHSDLKWRNIMVDIKADYPQIYLIDCPAGMKWYKPFLEYRIIKDLACLDKRAKYELSKKQRLAFYKDYAQCQKLSAKDKQRINKIVGFFHNRE